MTGISFPLMGLGVPFVVVNFHKEPKLFHERPKFFTKFPKLFTMFDKTGYKHNIPRYDSRSLGPKFPGSSILVPAGACLRQYHFPGTGDKFIISP